MKTLKYLLSTVVAMLLFIGNTTAKELTQSKDSAELKIQMDFDHFQADSVAIEVHPYGMLNNKHGIRQFSSRLDRKDILCRFNVPDHPYWIIITTFIKGFLNDYSSFYGMPGDDLSIAFTNGNAKAIGRGANRFNFSREIWKLRYKRVVTKQLEEGRITAEELYKFFDRKEDSVYNERLKVLARYKPSFTNAEYSLLYSDVFYDRQFSIAKGLYDPIVFPSKDEVAKRFFFNLFMEKFPMNKVPDSISDQNLVYCQSFSEFAFWRMIGQLAFRSGDFANRAKYSMKDITAYMEQHFAGELLEKMLTYSFHMCNNRKKEVPLELPLILPKIKNPEFKKVLVAIQNGNVMNAPIARFALPDAAGRVYTPDDFKGQVVIIDFWFTGCLPCAILKNETVELVAELSARKDVKFVSICLDGSAETWRTSLRSKKYTHDVAINLFTSGNRFDSPIAKFYNVFGCPRIIIVNREGIVVNSNVEHTPVSISAVLGKIL